ncbi:MAG: hypothetical protein ACYC2U_03000 [Candidatus Amoebophilus sp.]
MKEPQSLISILITVGYFLFRIVIAMLRDRTESIAKSDIGDVEDLKEEANWETPSTRNQNEWVVKEVRSIPQYAKDIVMPVAKDIVTTTVRQAATKSDVNPVYPGIKRLLLPTQEKNPYKLYEKTLPKHTNRLNYLLRNYNSTQRAIIMAELLGRKI